MIGNDTEVNGVEVTGDDQQSIVESHGADQYLTFVMDEEEYGVDILSVQEIRGWEKTTKIPNSPVFLKGVINLRGTIVPIIDLRTKFNLETVEYTPVTVVIVLKVKYEDSERTMGVVVDAVSDVYSISSENISSPPDVAESRNGEFLRGLAKVDDKMVIILELDKLLDDQEIASAFTE